MERGERVDSKTMNEQLPKKIASKYAALLNACSFEECKWLLLRKKKVKGVRVKVSVSMETVSRKR